MNEKFQEQRKKYGETVDEIIKLLSSNNFTINDAREITMLVMKKINCQKVIQCQ